MQKALIIFALLAISSLAIPVNLDELKTLWSSWKNYYTKSYSYAEEAARFAIFVENYKRIIDFNSKNTDVKQALNKFADITAEEFKTIYASGYIGNTQNVESPAYEAVELPASVDWRTTGALGPIENQGQCGSCWAFSATEALQSLYYIDTGKLVVFSEQQIVDCDTKCDGCDGGEMSAAFAYTASKGIEPASDYPYTAEDGTCKYDASKAIKVNSGFKWVTFRNADALKAAIVTQPVSIGIEADQDAFQFYSSGVITKDCGTNVDHGVLAVGYATLSGQEGFIVQNSWGADWGMNGYVYISTNGSANDGNGVCGILTGPVVPVK